jgi:hypothetical protein
VQNYRSAGTKVQDTSIQDSATPLELPGKGESTRTRSGWRTGRPHLLAVGLMLPAGQ